MELLTGLAFGLLGILIFSALALVPLKYRFQIGLKEKSDEELQKVVFRYESAYFDYLGHEDPEVTRFREIINAKDLNELCRNWKQFSRSFRKLERETGYRGRPLILDFYNWHEMAISELKRRASMGARDS
jgi:hypothetical protein